MPTTPHPVLRRRHFALTLIRASAIFFALLGMFTLGRHIVPLTERLIGLTEWSYWAAAANTLAAFLLPALLLAAFSRALATWIVPAPLTGCPACGYSIAAGQKVCPECGTSSLPETKDQPT